MIDKLKTTVELKPCQLPKTVYTKDYEPFIFQGIRFTANEEKNYIANRNSVSKAGLENLYLKFGWGEYANFYLSNSLHKLCHNGQNYTDFTHSQLIDTIDHISQILNIPSNEFKLHGQIEIAVNIPVDNANGLIDACIGFKSLHMENMKHQQKNYGKKAFGSKYSIKLYNPMLKLNYQGKYKVQDNNELLRFEIAIQKNYINKTWGIALHTLEDLQNKAILKALGNKLVQMTRSLKFEPVFPVEINPKDLQKYLYFRQKGANKAQLSYFRQQQPKTYQRHRAVYNRLQNTYGKHYSITEKVAKKWAFLLHY